MTASSASRRSAVSAATFIHEVAFADLPADVVAMAQRCLLDLAGVAASGSRAPSAAILRDYVLDQMAARDASARILFDGRRASLAGAAFAGATLIDAVDAHDGHPLTKGHAGAALLPGLLAFVDAGLGSARDVDGREWLTCLVLGYEIATRAGIALHESVSDYHCSGAWNSLGVAALGARLMGFGGETTRHALGIAEYLGPRGQILRVCDHPTMLKDGSGQGAHVGVSAVLLAARGFSGAPAITVEDPARSEMWDDLGERWRIREQYFKPHPVCRWAQPAIEAALALRRAHAFGPADVAEIRIESFAEAIVLGSQCARPATTDEAQYSLTYPVAAALVFGAVGVEALEPGALHDARIAALLDATRLVEAADLSRRFPAERIARVRIALRDGRRLESADTVARGSAENPLDESEMRAKYRALATPVLGSERALRIEHHVAGLPDAVPVDRLLDDLLAAVAAPRQP